MKTSSKISFFFLLLTIYSTFCQSRTWNIVLTNGDTLRECVYIGINDTLFFNSPLGKISLDADTIKCIYRYTESHFWTGALVGGLSGAIFGGLLGEENYKVESANEKPSFIHFGPIFDELLWGGIGGLIGSLFGGMLMSGEDEKYELSKISRSDKILLILKVMDGRH
jgi:hypothetical protein